MTATTFDTNRFIKRLKDTGTPEAQAEELIDIVCEVREEAKANLATKSDLKIALELQKREIIISIGAMLFALAGFLKFFSHS